MKELTLEESERLVDVVEAVLEKISRGSHGSPFAVIEIEWFAGLKIDHRTHPRLGEVIARNSRLAERDRERKGYVHDLSGLH